ncbi:MAG TPA: response regulator transcription factor [Gaiellaceae bacterium]|nr:response regulator transcription factor [Gaiellaceae bacterium]
MLVVDDEDAIRDAVAYVLRSDGNDVEVASTGEDAVEAVGEGSFDLVVLDVMLPDISGVEVARRVRAESDVPIIMLTARSSETDLVVGFEAGADDYVAKPFSVHELVSRARAILRRRQLDEGTQRGIRRVGDVELDLLRHEVRVGGRQVRLTPTEYRLLVKLAESDRAFGRRELLEAAWDTSFVPDPRSCDVHVANLRRKVEEDAADPQRVLTVRGVGYRLAR